MQLTLFRPSPGALNAYKAEHFNVVDQEQDWCLAAVND